MLEIDDFIEGLPKAELHVHIEGTLEPESMFTLAERNGVMLPYDSVTALRSAYAFASLPGFLRLYHQGLEVLQTERDFYDLTWAYLQRARADRVLHTEIFFDPQAHTRRGVAFNAVLEGIWRALEDGRLNLGISSRLIMCFQRDLPIESAMETLHQALGERERITAVGLDSAERGHPPSDFRAVFDTARAAGFLTVAHAGEDGPPDYVSQALDILHVERIDHGNRTLEDRQLVTRLVDEQIPLTVCPLSSVALGSVAELSRHPLLRMLQRGLMVTVNSGIPAYLDGYIGANYQAVKRALRLADADLYVLARNSFEASFAAPGDKHEHLTQIDGYAASLGMTLVL